MTTTATAVGARLFHSSIAPWLQSILGHYIVASQNSRLGRVETFTPTKLAAVKVNYCLLEGYRYESRTGESWFGLFIADRYCVNPTLSPLMPALCVGLSARR